MSTRLKACYTWIPIRHQWEYSHSNTQRRCQVCGKAEEMSCDDWGTFWIPLSQA